MDRLDFSQGIENPLNAGIPGGAKADIRKTKEKKDAGRRVFSGLMERSLLESADLGPLSSADPSEEALQNMLDDVRSAADNLRRRPLPDEMIQYKKAVRNFLHYVVENGFEVEQSQGIKRKVIVRGEKRWDSKMHQQVRVVDQKLEEMASGLLLKQINDLDLRNRLDEITGLLVDLTVTGKITDER